MFGKDAIFWFSAWAGSGLFLIQFVLNLFGMDSEADDHSAHDFKWLSKQAITGFLMIFGWVGLAAKREFTLSAPFAIGIATLAGLASMFITAWIFNLISKLHSSGTVFKIQEAIGKEASVYQRIPKDGVGKVTLCLQEMTHELEARSFDGEEIDSFSKVQIIQADETIVTVTLIK